MTFRQRLLRHPILIAAAIAVGLSVQLADRVLFSHALGRRVTFEDPVGFAMGVLFTAMPLIALALQARQHVVAWLAGFAPSAWLDWWWLQKGIAYQRNPDGSGVDGGAIILVLAPFVITAGCIWLNRRLTGNGANGS